MKDSFLLLMVRNFRWSARVKLNDRQKLSFAPPKYATFVEQKRLSAASRYTVLLIIVSLVSPKVSDSKKNIENPTFNAIGITYFPIDGAIK